MVYSDYVPLVNLISVFFQIRDDYMNLQSAEVSANDDLIILFLSHDFNDSPILVQEGCIC